MTQLDSKQQCVSLKLYGFCSEGPTSTLFTPKVWQGEWGTKVQWITILLTLTPRKSNFLSLTPQPVEKCYFQPPPWTAASQSSRSVAKYATQGEEVLAAFSDLNSYVCRNPEPKVLGWHCCLLSCCVMWLSRDVLTLVSKDSVKSSDHFDVLCVLIAWF